MAHANRCWIILALERPKMRGIHMGIHKAPHLTLSVHLCALSNKKLHNSQVATTSGVVQSCCARLQQYTSKSATLKNA